mmetsp:Transcript_24027/g.67102  ORF Transcript_24027/g.67102 Transcript_24027/m.67102 type:complete len:81 (+) Transcript_24027:13-255(+)
MRNCASGGVGALHEYEYKQVEGEYRCMCKQIPHRHATTCNPIQTCNNIQQHAMPYRHAMTSIEERMTSKLTGTPSNPNRM